MTEPLEVDAGRPVTGRLVLAAAVGLLVGVLSVLSLPGRDASRPPPGAGVSRATTPSAAPTIEVRRSEGPRLQLTGSVVEDPRSLRTVTAWADGRITSVSPLGPGEPVHAGETLATLFSPEIHSAHRKLLDAKAAGAGGDAAALAAARGRLQLLGISPVEVAQMEAAPQPSREVALRSPFSGTVLERLAVEGAHVQTGSALYRIADAAHFWARLDADPRELRELAIGQRVEVEIARVDGQRFEGRIEALEAPSDETTEAQHASVELSNPQAYPVRPGMPVRAWVQAKSSVSHGAEPLQVPQGAVLAHAGAYTVYVQVPDSDPRAFQARHVRVGPLEDGRFPVVSGLREGERVLADAAAALPPTTLTVDAEGPTGPATPGGARQSDPYLTLSEASLAALRPVVEAYLALLPPLAAGELESAQRAAQRLSKRAHSARLEAHDAARAQWTLLSGPLHTHATALAAAETLEAARGELEVLSRLLERALASLGNPLTESLHVGACPMASASPNATWLQRGETLLNPYFGEGRRGCCRLLEEVAAGGHLVSDPANMPLLPAQN